MSVNVSIAIRVYEDGIWVERDLEDIIDSMNYRIRDLETKIGERTE